MRPWRIVADGTSRRFSSTCSAYRSGSGASAARRKARITRWEAAGMGWRVARVVMQVSHKARVWIALWTVYIVWGSTYLGIELAGETIPGVFGAGVRFTVVGLVMFGIVLWRRGRQALR